MSEARERLIDDAATAATARFSLGLPENLRAKLEAAARRYGISLNAVMILLLNDTLLAKKMGVPDVREPLADR